MRRSSRASLLINQSGNDDIYKFRCMQYLNFVLDQVINEDTKFKLYASHIESLLRNNLNEITIQDIQKIKRMLEEGQKQKIQTQQTGDFINYDLIDKQKYFHFDTHYVTQKNSQQALLNLFSQNDYTLHEIQMIKNQQRMEKLNEKNFKTLKQMFKMPQDFSEYEEELQQRYRKDKQLAQPQNQQLQFQQMIHQKQKINYLQNNSEIAKYQTQNLFNHEGQIAQQIKAEAIQQKNTKIKVPSQQQKEKEKQPRKDQQNDLTFVKIQKKKKEKKKPTQVQQQLQIQNNQQKVLSFIAQKKQIEKKQDKNEEKTPIDNYNANQKNQNESKVEDGQPQKRKYIRKKPLEPKKSKSEKPQKPEKQMKNNENFKSIQIQENKLKANTGNEEQEKPSEINVSLQQIVQSAVDQKPVKKNEISGSATKKISTEGKKQSKPKKLKSSKQKSQQNQKSQQKKKKPRKQFEIILPFPQCQKQCNQIQKQIEQLGKNLLTYQREFQLNKQIVEKSIYRLHEQEYDKKNLNVNPQKIQFVSSEPNEEKLQMLNMQEKFFEKNMVSQQKRNEIMELLNNPLPNLEMLDVKKLDSKLQKQKSKGSSKLITSKKQSKKSESESYKPAQDQLQSISQLAPDGKSVGQNYQPDKKQKKYKKKIAKKKPLKQKSKSQKQKSQQKINTKSLQIVIPQNNELKQTKRKAILQEKQKAREEKQMIKLKKLKEKQQRKKIKELQRLQKQDFRNIMAKLQKNQKSSSIDKKKSQADQHNSVSANDNNLHLQTAIAENKKQQSSQKKSQTIQIVQHLMQKSTKLQKQQKLAEQQKKIQEGMAFNLIHETKAPNFINDWIGKPIDSRIQQNFDIQQSKEIQQSLEFVSIKPNDTISNEKYEKIVVMDSLQEQNQISVHINWPKRQKSKQVDVQKDNQIFEIDSGANKNVKIVKKFQQILQDPQYGIENQQRNELRQTYKIRVIERGQMQQQLNKADNREIAYEQEEKNSSSLSAEDV